MAERHATAVTTMTIATSDELGTVTGYVSAKGLRLPVVLDADGSMLRTWGLSAIPALVMLDRTGAVAALRLGPVTPADLEEMYADLAAGKPIPTPAPTPEPSSGSAPTQVPGATETVTGLAQGDPAPSWSGPLLTGGTLDSSALLGKPTILWFLPRCATCPTADLEAFQAAYRQAGAAANFVMVASGEPTPGYTAALFRRLGITVLLVFDWDHRIASAFRMNVLGTVILDAEGRIAHASPGALSADDLVGLTEKLGPTPTPTGS